MGFLGWRPFHHRSRGLLPGGRDDRPAGERTNGQPILVSPGTADYPGPIGATRAGKDHPTDRIAAAPVKLSALAMYANAAYNFAGPFIVRRLTDCVIVSVRGTRDPADFITDMECLKCKFLGHNAHSGFVDEFCDLWGPISNQLSRSDKVYVTGHSLGGAVATILAWALKAHHDIDSTVATFGSPRVFDSAGAEAYNQAVPNTTRVVHKLDLVPRVPKIDYQHVDKELHLDDDGVVLLSDAHWFKWLLRVFISDVDGVSLANHHMPTYLRSVFAYEELYQK